MAEGEDETITVRTRPDTAHRATLFMLLPALLWAWAAQAGTDAIRQSIDAGLAAVQSRGAAAAVEDHLLPAARAARNGHDPALRIDAEVALASAYQRLGMNTLALETLTDTIAVADELGDPAQQARVRDALGLVQQSIGRYEEAIETLQQGLDFARTAGQDSLEASLLNDVGLAWARSGLEGPTAIAFAQSMRVAEEAGREDVYVSACLNGARFEVAEGRFDGLDRQMDRCRAGIDRLPAGRQAGGAYLALGTIYRDARIKGDLAPAWRRRAFDAFDAGRIQAAEAGDGRLESFALGYLGGLYEEEDRLEEALAYSRRAAFLAQASGAPDSLYLWQWQTARLLRAMGREEAAIGAYRRTIETLDALRPSLVAGTNVSFRERVGPVFFELADMLLQRSATLEDPGLVEQNLLAVRETLEQVKVAEVQQYFQDQCLKASSEATEVERLGGKSAVIYPILLHDRTELLVSMPSGLKQYTTRVGIEQLTVEVRDFRKEIERYDGEDDYLNHGRRLYEWLIAPAVPDLEAEGVTTLVFVPDGPLRTIPMSALYDGERFLIERYAFATTPGLTLTSPAPLHRDDVEMLASGLTESVQGFPALPNVETELASIRKRFSGKVYKDSDFQASAVEQEISGGEYTIVHIATHGQFDSDHARSFLLTYDDKLTMEELQETIAARRYQEEPVELLVLSACQTAAGDDRAALGLAGVALQAGARSAVATLWFISDESTTRMVSEFYELLEETDLSKAEALQQAQLSLLADPRYSHPSYWAPFLLIGNWL